jgi:hypothetical protein
MQFTEIDGKIFLRSYRCVCIATVSPQLVPARACVFSISFCSIPHHFTYLEEIFLHLQLVFWGRRILLKKSGSRTPRVELEEIGPSLDLVKRRVKLASDDLWKTAIKKPKTVKVTETLPVLNLSRPLLITQG